MKTLKTVNRIWWLVWFMLVVEVTAALAILSTGFGIYVFSDAVLITLIVLVSVVQLFSFYFVFIKKYD